MEKLFKIKPLEWKETDLGNYVANTPFPMLTYWAMYQPTKQDGKWMPSDAGIIFAKDTCDGTLEDAQRLCQELHNSRLLASLEESDVVSRVREECRKALDGKVNLYDDAERMRQCIKAKFAQTILTILNGGEQK